MPELNPQIIKDKTIELAYAARIVIQQLASQDRTLEGLKAQEILEDALTRAIPDAGQVRAVRELASP